MGLMNKTTQVAKLSVCGDIPLTNKEQLVIDKLKNSRFRTEDEFISGHIKMGWVQFDDSDNSTFEQERDIFRQTYACFGFRVDEKKISKPALKIAVKKEIERLQALAPNEKIDKEKRDNIKEAIYQDMLSKTTAIPTVYDVVWNLSDDVLYFSNINEKKLELFFTFFFSSFEGMHLQQILPYHECLNILPKDLQEKFTAMNQAGGSEDLVDIKEYNSWIGNKFLQYLIRNTEKSKNSYTVPIKGVQNAGTEFIALMDEFVSLVSVDLTEEKPKFNKTVISRAIDFNEIKTAYKNEKLPVEAKIYIQKGELSFEFILKSLDFFYTSLKTPKVEVEKSEDIDKQSENESSFLEKMYMLESTFQMFDGILLEFLKEYIADVTKFDKSIEEWTQE